MEKIKLFCLPYAGGSAALYMKWKSFLHPSIHIVPIELAGRGKRYSEPFYSDIEQAVHDIYEKIKDELDKLPYALFGHSMGGLLAFEIAHKIQVQEHRAPKIIFLSGKNPPHCQNHRFIHHLPNKELINEILEMGGTPKEILQHNELLEILIPILRADFTLVENYHCNKREEILDCDLVIMNGRQDNLTKNSDMKEWSRYTKREVRTYHIDGGHFFINEHLESVLNLIHKELIHM
ncbi:thioesterase II family protein [Paenibacillus jiagnxiensis]|uniref:thioesterase II family protein n=1 Tax=Paenibacillus jiagnxiensis TaxID=3228926 RepID=UPI0033B4103B